MTHAPCYPSKDDVLACLAGRVLSVYAALGVQLKAAGSELRGPCPLHGGKDANFAVNRDTGAWFCHSQCQEGGDVIEIVERVRGCEFAEALAWLADVTGCGTPSPAAQKRNGHKPNDDPRIILDDTLVEEAHKRLLAKPRVVAWLVEHRGWSRDGMCARKIGLVVEGAEYRITIPIYDLDGRLVNVRRYLPQWKADMERVNKMLPWQSGLPCELFPLDVVMDADHVIVCEGEPDLLALLSLGFSAVCGTAGAGTWKDEWTDHLCGKERVTILYDNDDAGHKGAQKVAQALSGAVGEVRIASIPAGCGCDITDWIVQHGATRDDIQAAIDAAEPFDAHPAELIESTAPAAPWPELDNAALHGLAGDFVRLVEPVTEADCVALLTQFLVFFGNSAGRNAYVTVGADRHGTNLFLVLVGKTSRARKGTSEGFVRCGLSYADQAWLDTRVMSGLSSGEGLIHAVRDRIEKEVEDKESGETKLVVVDDGVTDKRLLVVEGEFAIVLKQTARDGNTLSPTLRNAWDGKPLQTLVKNSPARATNSHISIAAHITQEELRRDLNATEVANGFANRFLFACVRRSKLLARGGKLPASDLESLGHRIADALSFARSTGELDFDEDANSVWHEVYPNLTRDHAGLFGALTARSEAQVLRLSLIYALLNCSEEIRREHLLAALAVWEYCEASVRFLFGDSLGDRVADQILAALRRTGADGMNRSQISGLFGRNLPSERLTQALNVLISAGMARTERLDGRGGGDIYFGT